MLPARNVQHLTFFGSLAVVLGIAGSLALAGCAKEPAEPAPKKVDRGVDTKKIPVPNHSAEVMSDPGKPRRVGTTGKMTALVGGRTQTFTFFPRGLNAAAASQSTGNAWLKIRGSLDSDGGAYLELSVDNFKLDEAKFPVTLTAAGGTPTTPRLTATYGIDPAKLWRSKPGASAEGSATVVLESFTGKVLKGRFDASLLPRAGNDPIAIEDGVFEVELRLNGVEEGAKGAETPE